MSETLKIVIENDASTEWLRSIMNEGSQAGNNQVQKAKFQKVPRMLRSIESNSECYDPLVVSIGPYHHGKPDLQEMERFKVTMARQFVEDSGKPIEEFYWKVVEVANDAKKCYSEGSAGEFDDRAFTQMMFIDGCFILQFILQFISQSGTEMKRHFEPFIVRDLFLLENQIPFAVLKSLMSLRFKEGEGMKMINQFIDNIRDFPSPSQEDSIKERMKRAVKRFWPRAQTLREKTQGEQDHEPLHLLQHFHTQFTAKKKNDPKPRNKEELYWCSFRSAKELKSVGIHFRTSKTASFIDLHFTTTFLAGVLRLPPIRVDDLTKSLLLNLVAYESCPGASNGAEITSYICFMDSLIDHAEDVKELRSKGILLNFLGSDQEAAQLFNEISKYLVLHQDAFWNVRKQIQWHYKNITKRWMAEWLHVHFSSPWTVLAFAAASFALVLTGIQTYLTAFPPEK